MNTIQKFQQAILFIVLIALISTVRTLAQPPQQQKENIEARHIGFITNQLQLTPEEAKAFWPVYNLYHAEVEALRKNHVTELLSAKVNFESYTDDQVSKLIDDEMEYRQKELDIQRKYNPEFKKVLPVKKVAKFYRAEQQFKINLIRDMQNNQGAKPGKQGNNPPHH
ncbi:MAG TPA: hypothetical protein VE978_18215 [Chitinophagales bacterium]|nr:hypothetical protein [Chitinophagales bacterium]